MPGESYLVMSYRALLVGAGGMGKTWARNLDSDPRVELGGWVDIRPGQAAGAAAELNLRVTCGTDLLLVIRSLEPDFVVDVTIPEAHEQVTLTALAAGIPV